ncbi:hypothetical protein Tco_1038250, partial [Tanacetum coccineum]
YLSQPSASHYLLQSGSCLSEQVCVVSWMASDLSIGCSEGLQTCKLFDLCNKSKDMVSSYAHGCTSHYLCDSVAHDALNQVGVFCPK